jgi:putative pyruvate formate lyase activating enzyme
MSAGRCRDLPGYLALLARGELDRRVAALRDLISPCVLCPRRCRVDRWRRLGRCATPAAPVVASYGPHLGEEPPISGARGSGTLFLANCNLRCVFCQNAEISQRPRSFIGAGTTPEALAGIMIELQDDGCHNVNWVSPTHQVVALVEALAIAARRGLELPIVYNTNAYDSPEVLALLEGVVDVWMPDLKYSDEGAAAECSRVRRYPETARAAIAEMFRQVGAGWEVDGDGVLRRGLLVRLLVLPHDLAGVEASLRWIAEALSPEVVVSLMSQYRPSHLAARAGRYPRLARGISPSEFHSALQALERWSSSEASLVQPFLRLQ